MPVETDILDSGISVKLYGDVSSDVAGKKPVLCRYIYHQKHN